MIIVLTSSIEMNCSAGHARCRLKKKVNLENNRTFQPNGRF